MADRRQRGFSMLEVLVTILILSLGLFGIMRLMARAQEGELEAYQRVQALILVQDMVDRINANRGTARCYDLVEGAGGADYLGTDFAGVPACAAWGTATTQARAVADLSDWDQLLKGASESVGANTTGAMIGARGCISYDAATDAYQVSVAWQGVTPTVDPTSIDATLTCGSGLYGDETRRRTVSRTVRIADLS